MSQTSNVQRAAAHEQPTGELIKQLTEQVSTLVRDELKLAQVEMTRKGRQAVAGVAALIGKNRVQQATPPVPEEAVDSVKTDVEEIKERARRS